MRIGIIGGGGAGLTAAWLLEEEHDVTLYERATRLGGHAWTIPVEVAGQTFPMDVGFEFFSANMFPTFERLLRRLDVPLRPYAASVTLYSRERVRVLPPSRAGRLYWPGLGPRPLADLVRLVYLLRRADDLMRRRDTTVTLQAFVDSTPLLSQAFKEEFLYPFLLAQWCVEPAEFRQFMAYNALRYAYLHLQLSLQPPQMLEPEGGMEAYIGRIERTLQRARLQLSADVSHLTRTDQGWQVEMAGSGAQTHDALIIAANARAGARLLADVAGQTETARQLGRIEFFPTTIALHGDTRLMPARRAQWSVVNTRFDGHYAQNTIWKAWRSRPEQPIFKSWVTFEPQLPEPLYRTVTFEHPKINRAYFEAQAALAALQGRDNLYLAGVHTQDVDCHESAIRSAVAAARRLSPRSSRLRWLEAG